MSQNTRKDPRAKVLTMTVRYRSATIDEFIEHHSYDVSRGGMFIKTPSPFPAGTLLKFEVKIAEDQKVMQGVGRVVWKRETNDPDPDKPQGMGVKFIKIDEESRAVIERLLSQRAPGSESAYDAGQAAQAAGGSSLPPAPLPSGPVFPQSSPADMPAPEDRTVMKPAAELLQDALKQAGGAAASLSPEPPPVSPAQDAHVETKRSSGRSEPPVADEAAAAAAWAHDALKSLPDKEVAAFAKTEEQPPKSEGKAAEKAAEKVVEKPAEKMAEPAPSKAAGKVASRPSPPSPPRRAEAKAEEKEAEAPPGERRPSRRPSRPPVPEVEEEGGSGGKAVLLFLVAAAVAGGIYFLSKRGQEPVPEPTPPAAVQAEPTPPAQPTTPPAAEPAPTAPEESAIPGADPSALVPAVPSAVQSAPVPPPAEVPPIAPTPRPPRPAAKPKPKPETPAETPPAEVAPPAPAPPAEVAPPAPAPPAEPKPAEPKPAPKEAPPATDNPY